MSWTASLRSASFRGIQFGVFGAQAEYGRRVVTHIFPLRDDPFHEDMGRHPRSIAVDGFIVGADVLSRVKSLEAALERGGPGLLVHPYYGSLNVVGLKHTTSFVAYEGRVARVQMQFEEAGLTGLPMGIINAIAALLGNVSGTVTALVEFVSVALAATAAVSHVRDALATDVRSTASALRSYVAASGLVAGAARLGPVVAVDGGQPVTALQALDTLTVVDAETLGQPAPVVRLLSRTISAIANVPTPVKSFSTERDEQVRVVDVLLAMTGSVAVRPGGSRETANRAALALLIDGCALAAACEAASNVVWDSREQLDDYASRIARKIDEATDQAGALGWDESWRDLNDLGSAWAKHVAQARVPLPRVRAVVLPATTSATLLAYQLDGDALDTLFGRGGSIARRNNARHPAFLPGGVDLEVVENG